MGLDKRKGHFFSEYVVYFIFMQLEKDIQQCLRSSPCKNRSNSSDFSWENSDFFDELQVFNPFSFYLCSNIDLIDKSKLWTTAECIKITGSILLSTVQKFTTTQDSNCSTFLKIKDKLNIS